MTRWPFVESPGDFSGRMERAYRDFNGDMLAAVRNCLIENAPALSASPAPAVGGLESGVGETAYAKVRVDTDPKDGWAFVTPSRHPDDIANGLAEGAWEERYQFFGELVALASPAATSAEQGGDGVREAPTVAKLFGNCDNWGAAEWFERLANAVMEQDKAIAAEDMLSFETYRNIAASSAMELVRGYRTEVRAALAPSTSAATRREPVAIPAGWKLVPLTPTLDMQRAYFDEVDRNMTRVENDYTFGRFDNNRLAYRAMLIAAPPPPAPAESARVKGAESAAPTTLGMPIEEDVARAIYHGKPRNRPWDILPHEFKNQYRKQARAVLALFAPVLAEKEREIERACADHANATIGWERERARSEELEARALAAEAALAAERANAVDGSIDIRLDDKGGIDEVFGNGVLCHIERMSKGEWFVIMTRPDQSQEAFWLTGKGKVEFTLHEHRKAPTTGPNVDPWTVAAIRSQEQP